MTMHDNPIAADDPVNALNHDNIEAFADDVDLSEFDDDALDRLDQKVSDLLNGDPYDFPSDEALDAATKLANRLTKESRDRDPATDDPYHRPGDTEARYDLPIKSVEIINRGPHNNPTISIRMTVDNSPIEDARDKESKWSFRETTELAELAADHYGIDDPREFGKVVGKTLPVVGSEYSEYSAWHRVDRYALENNGETAIDT